MYFKGRSKFVSAVYSHGSEPRRKRCLNFYPPAANLYPSNVINASQTDSGPAGRRMPALEVQEMDRQWRLLHYWVDK